MVKKNNLCQSTPSHLALITLSSLLETRNYNYNRPRRTIKSFRSLSKQAKKEWMYKHRNASSFNWDEEEEM